VKVGRPKFHPGYGIAAGEEGLLPWEWADERLAAAHNYWIAANGPVAAPVWGVWLGGAFVFGTNPESAKGRSLRRDPRIVVHLESGDEVVMLHGRVGTLDAELAVRAGPAYKAKYDIATEPGEGWYVLRPSHVHAWLESDYPRTATRFDF
jgi:hypothetical protein